MLGLDCGCGNWTPGVKKPIPSSPFNELYSHASNLTDRFFHCFGMGIRLTGRKQERVAQMILSWATDYPVCCGEIPHRPLFFYKLIAILTYSLVWILTARDL